MKKFIKKALFFISLHSPKKSEVSQWARPVPLSLLLSLKIDKLRVVTGTTKIVKQGNFVKMLLPTPLFLVAVRTFIPLFMQKSANLSWMRTSVPLFTRKGANSPSFWSNSVLDVRSNRKTGHFCKNSALNVRAAQHITIISAFKSGTSAPCSTSVIEYDLYD